MNINLYRTEEALNLKPQNIRSDVERFVKDNAKPKHFCLYFLSRNAFKSNYAGLNEP